MTTTCHPRRGGFTLIELLIVVAILAGLTAIGTYAYFRIRGQEEVRASEATLNKLASGIERLHKAVLDDVADDFKNGRIPPGVVEYAGNDRERARIVWAYIRMKQQFPTSVAEATTQVVFGSYTMQPLKAFAKLSGAGPAEEQSSACLYVALMDTGLRGVRFEGDGTTNQTAVDSSGRRVFKDAAGVPIAFVRLAFADELDQAPYVKTALRDPLDRNPPQKLVAGWSNLNDFWAKMLQNHINYTNRPPAYPARNWVPCVVSAGANADFDGDDFFSGTNDNLVSFRLRKEGAGGQ